MNGLLNAMFKASDRQQGTRNMAHETGLHWLTFSSIYYLEFMKG